MYSIFFLPLFDNCRLYSALCIFFNPPKLIYAAVLLMRWLLCLSSVIRSLFERWGEFILETRRLFPIWVSAPSVSLPHCLRHESRDTVQVRPTWQEGELQRKAEFISCSCESYISTIPLCAVWQQRNDGCHLSCGLKEAVGKGI